MNTWYRVRSQQASAGAQRLWDNPVSVAKTGNAVIAYPDGRAYLGETIRHINAQGKHEMWVESFVLGDSDPCPAPDGWRDAIIAEIERPL